MELELVCRSSELAPNRHHVPGRLTCEPAYLSAAWGLETPVPRLVAGETPPSEVQVGGDWSQCARTATFTGLTLTEAIDAAVAQGWAVDAATVGFFRRADICPGCNPGGGVRWIVYTRDGVLPSTYADTHDRRRAA